MADKEQKQSEVSEEPPEGQQASAEPEAQEGQPLAETGQAPAEDAGEVEAGADDELGQLQEEVGRLKDVALRAQAEAQNAQRRAEQDVEKARKFALESFTRELLPVVDNLERALESVPADSEEVKPFVEGVELTLKSLMDALGKFNIEPVDPQGEPFDPQLHQAMSMVENPEVEPNTVIAVMQKGYTLNSRLVRPAMVMVSKAAS